MLFTVLDYAQNKEEISKNWVKNADPSKSLKRAIHLERIGTIFCGHPFLINVPTES